MNHAKFCTLFLILNLAWLQAQTVKMYEQQMVIPTYPVGSPEINPIFYTPTSYQGAQNRVYPYPNLDKLSDKKVAKTYNGIFLENEYLKICVLPEIGGRLYIANDKTNGYDFFYHNQVIKPSLIGMAGAWISGGIEWNIPHHHRVSTFMPVDYRMVDNPDSSKTIWVGEYEKRHRTKWVVGLTLRPGKSYIEVSLRYFNVTPQITSLLMWANPAVHANENYQVIFPPDVEYAVFHGKTEFINWPIAHQFYQGIDFTKGVDVSWWKNTSSPTSFFQWGSEQNFVGGIDHGKNTGTVIVGDHFTCPGKKMWNWGNNAVARLWDQILTDTDGPYIELMASAFSDNQPDYSWCDPFSAKMATHYYFPIKGMANIVEANKDAALNLEVGGGKAHIELNTTAKYDSLKLQLLIDDKIAAEKEFSADPGAVFKYDQAVDASVTAEQVKVVILSHDNNELIAYQAKPKKNLAKPETYQTPKLPAEIETVDELYETGLRLEQFYNAYINPISYYEEGLRRDPKNVDIKTQLGIHYIKNYDFEKAEKYLAAAADVVTANYTRAKNCEPLYYLGLTLYNQRKYKEAYEWLQKAAWSHGFASASLYLCATIDCMNRDFDKALENLQRSCLENNLNIETLKLKAVVLRKTGRNEQALAAIQSCLAVDPVDFIGLYELSALGKNFNTGISTDSALKDFTAPMRDEPDNYLETAWRYASAGFYEDALQILQLAISSGDERLSKYPAIYYFTGYCYLFQNEIQQARAMFDQAAALPVDYCFTYGKHSIDVLTRALEFNPADAHAWYLLGNTYADFQADRAIQCWQRAVELKSSFAIAYRNLAGLYAHQKDDVKKAIEMIDKAIALNPDDPQYLVEADMYYGYAGFDPAKRLKLFTDHKNIINKIDAAVVKYNNLQVLFGNYQDVLKSLQSRNIHAYERFNTNYHVTWVDANVLQGIKFLKQKKYAQAIPLFEAALTFPRNLEIAVDSKAAIALYYLGLAYKLSGNREKAAQYFSKTVAKEDGSRWAGEDWPEVLYSQALAYRELENPKAAEDLFGMLKERGAELLEEKPNPVAYTASVENRWQKRKNQAKGYYLQALGNLGLGQLQAAKQLFERSLQLEPSFLSAKAYRFE